nr:hypothetical protein [Tanacetum cinerariifolium]
MYSSHDKDADEVPDKEDKGVCKGSGIDDQDLTDSSTQDVNTAELRCLPQCLLTQRFPPGPTKLRAPECPYHYRRILMRLLGRLTYTPPTYSVEESEGLGTFGMRSMSSDSTASLLPDHPLTHTTPVLVPSLCRTARMAVRLPPTMSHGLFASIAYVAAMSDSAFHKMFRSSYDSLPSPILLVWKRYREDRYEAIRQAYLVGMDTESEPFEGEAETPKSPHTVAPPTCRAKELEEFHKRFKSSYNSSPSSTFLVRKRLKGMFEIILDTDSEGDELGEEEDEEVEESSDLDSKSKDAEDECPTVEDDDPVTEDEGHTAGDKGPSMEVKILGLGGDEAVPGNIFTALIGANHIEVKLEQTINLEDVAGKQLKDLHVKCRVFSSVFADVIMKFIMSLSSSLAVYHGNAINKTYNSISDLWKEIVQLKNSLVKAKKYAAEAQAALDGAESKPCLLTASLLLVKILAACSMLATYSYSSLIFVVEEGHVSVSTTAVKDDLIVADGFHGELIYKYLNKPRVSFATKIATDETAITNSVDISYSLSGTMRLMTANNDTLIRVFDAKSFTCVDKFPFPWCVNSKVEYASHIINLCTSCSMEFMSITYNNVRKSHQANPAKMVLPPMFGPINFVTTDMGHEAQSQNRPLTLKDLEKFFYRQTGLAALIQNTEREVATQLVGSFGYSAPEFAFSSIYTIKSDVYSFGVVILTGRKPLDW